ncbi:MAG TPA: energy-coupling factor transporter ATPase [Syntrophorhabdaceae bacterium]|nr:energy-coupling factor transporter ATPase [Syntrophorhabdaceae bacterium]HOL06336.1 energy-coupling factor transporter ATPase [Syntrophorhabdaceae bacterium]HON85862.1 energy-coupling factor transporter ATPase [Syntrophorhabdaceae bacterium]HOT41777.1 energy-coupling factor transporter ATPase [Syntrophorhabdaceae bacterium]HPC67267.1 energy-coupling factor transporter ATPase [Syntrophorhabdaceae bacterium]
MGVSISIKSLSFTYHNSKQPAIKDINGEIKDGEFVVIMGHGGAGKSTLCYATNGIVPRFYRGGEYRGNVYIADRSVREFSISEMAKTVGLVFQDFEAQLFSTNVELEIAFGLENIGLPRDEISRRIDRYIDFLDLKGKRLSDTSILSGGQKQRLAIGAVIAMEPSVVVMDEPTSDLDPLGRAGVLSLAGLLRERKRTLVMVDYDPDTPVGADQLWLMKDGEIIGQGRPEKYLSDEKLLLSCGVMPPQTVSLFNRMGWEGSPLTVEAAKDLIEKGNLVKRRNQRKQKDSYFNSNNFFIEARGVYFRYPNSGNDVLRDINFGIKKGEFIAILGQNGSGKTTIAKHLNRLLAPTSGDILIDGKPTTRYRHNELARLVGYVFQNPDYQIFASTVQEEVGFGLKTLGEDHKTIKRNVAEALAVTGLEGYEHRSPFVLTKGERQRVAVASVLSVKPEVIILDEPTTGLDYQHQRDSLEMLKDLNRKGHTVIIITHSMWIAEEYAHRCIVMKDGKVLDDGETRSVFAHEQRLSQASLIPSPIVRLSNWLGADAMTVEGLAEELKSYESLTVSG